MARYKAEKCGNCKREARAINTTIQNVIQGILFTLAIIPGVIYWFLSQGKICHICGLKF